MPPRVKPLPMWGQVADDLREEIAKGTYRPGQPLPSERALSELYGVSTHVIRQATRTLQEEGWVNIRRPHGTLVTDPYTRPEHTDYRAADASIGPPGDRGGEPSRGLVWSPGE